MKNCKVGDYVTATVYSFVDTISSKLDINLPMGVYFGKIVGETNNGLLQLNIKDSRFRFESVFIHEDHIRSKLTAEEVMIYLLEE